MTSSNRIGTRVLYITKGRDGMFEVWRISRARGREFIRAFRDLDEASKLYVQLSIGG